MVDVTVGDAGGALRKDSRVVNKFKFSGAGAGARVGSGVGSGVPVGVGTSISWSTYRTSSTRKTGCALESVLLMDGRRFECERELAEWCVSVWEGRLDRAGDEYGEQGGAGGGSGGSDCNNLFVSDSVAVENNKKIIFYTFSRIQSCSCCWPPARGNSCQRFISSMRDLSARSRSRSSNSWSAGERFSCDATGKKRGSYEGQTSVSWDERLCSLDDVGAFGQGIAHSEKPRRGESAREGSISDKAKSY